MGCAVEMGSQTLQIVHNCKDQVLFATYNAENALSLPCLASRYLSLQMLTQHTITVITVMKKAMYPIDLCLDLSKEDDRWFDDLKQDPAYSHTMLYISQAYFDLSRSQVFGTSAIARMNDAIVMLRKKLAETNLIVTDSIVLTVLALAMMSQTVDDVETTDKHMHGLHQLIEIRGGLKSLDHKRLLQVKCCRSVFRYPVQSTSIDVSCPQNRFRICP